MTPDLKNTDKEDILRGIYGETDTVSRYFYSILSIIDSKAAALLTFNAIGLTAISVWLGNVPANWLHFVLDIVFLLFLISCMLCLYVVNLYWSSAAEGNASDKVARLVRKRDSRTAAYRAAWWISVSAVLLLILITAFHTVGSYLQASDTCDPTCQRLFGQGMWGSFDFD